MDHTGQVHLLLGAPGQPPPALPESAWRMWVLAADGPIDPSVAASRARLSPVAPRSERTLVTTVAADDIDGLLRLTADGGGAQDAARILTVGRLGAVDRGAAIDLTAGILRDVADPSGPKVLRRHFPDLHLLVPLAPSVPALVPLSRVGLGLLLADMHVSTGRPAEALAVLRALPSHPAVQLALAATLLGNGEHDRVLEITTDTANLDDVSALALVARSVAARTTGDLAAALDAACGALADSSRSPGVVAAALEERSHLYTVADQEDAARADMEALASLAAGLGAVEIPEATPVQRAAGSPAPVEQTRDRARERMRRRITGVGEPGTFGGRHHSTYREEIAAMFALGQTDAVEELLLGLLDAVEDEVAELHVPFDPTFFLTLADLYNDCGRTEDLAALRDRYAAAEARAARLSGTPVPGRGGAAPSAEAPTPVPSVGSPVADPAPATALAGDPVSAGTDLFATGPAEEDGVPAATVASSAPTPSAWVPSPPEPTPSVALGRAPSTMTPDPTPAAGASAPVSQPGDRPASDGAAPGPAPRPAAPAPVADPVDAAARATPATPTAVPATEPATVAVPAAHPRPAIEDVAPEAGASDTVAPEAPPSADEATAAGTAAGPAIEDPTSPPRPPEPAFAPAGPAGDTIPTAGVDDLATRLPAEPPEGELVGVGAGRGSVPDGATEGDGRVTAHTAASPHQMAPAETAPSPAGADAAEASPGDTDASGEGDDDDDERARRLRALQRTVRGPRVRSL